QRGRRVADPAFREDALRQWPAARAAGGSLARHARTAVCALRRRDRGLDPARDAVPRRRLLLLARRRQRARGRQVLRLGPRRGEGAAHGGGVRRDCRALWARAAAELRKQALEFPRGCALQKRENTRRGEEKTFCPP